ncbi:MAG: hypothetical protein GY804_06455 [Alphaproteobacteria bacterium]|nr:hypothetical protein [Alphaproteobacteria bacterium]
MTGIGTAALDSIVYTPVRSIDAAKAVQRKEPEDQSEKDHAPHKFTGIINQEQSHAKFQSKANLFNAYNMPYEEHAANNNYHKNGNLSAFASASSTYDDAQFHTDAMTGALPFDTIGSSIDVFG